MADTIMLLAIGFLVGVTLATIFWVPQARYHHALGRLQGTQEMDAVWLEGMRWLPKQKERDA